MTIFHQVYISLQEVFQGEFEFEVIISINLKRKRVPVKYYGKIYIAVFIEPFCEY